ncbi:type-X family DNA polymerase, partial [bacterium]|nr:type-X family DNA polymerase [bacterium]
MDRKQISDILDECGTLLELKGENPFRANAYHNASRAIQQLEGNVAGMLADGSLAKIKGLGQTMIEKIEEMLSTGKLSFHEKLKQEIPQGLVDMLRLSGFGPKRIKQVYADLGIDSIESLKVACEDGRIAGLKGFGQKSATKLLESIQFLETSGQRLMLPIALELAERLRDSLAKHPGVKRIEICGSLRRRKETIGDIDLLVSSDDAAPIMKIFVEHLDVMQVIGHGPTKSSVLLKNGINADLRVVTDEQFPFALHYFTGSKQHNVAMRARAQEFNLKLNEYELAGPNSSVKCKEESDIF